MMLGTAHQSVDVPDESIAMAKALRNRVGESCVCGSEGFPERDMWSLGVMDQGSCQIGRVLGTSSSSPSPGRGTMFGVKLDFDSYESSRNFDTRVLHRIPSRIDLA